MEIKNKRLLFIINSSMVVLLLFGTSAVCNMCTAEGNVDAAGDDNAIDGREYTKDDISLIVSFK